MSPYVDCDAFYTLMASEFNLNLNVRPALTHTMNYTRNKCEAGIDWNGDGLSVHRMPVAEVQKSSGMFGVFRRQFDRWLGIRNSESVRPPKFIHESVVQNLKTLLELTKAPPFRGHLYTADNSMCHPLVDRLVEHSQSPFIRDTILLPIHNNQMKYIQNWTAPFARRIHNRTCAWHGSRTGYATLQSKYNFNRTSCPNHLSDRQCVVRLGLSNVSFGVHSAYKNYDCMLAIDGNTFASSFKTSLHLGQLVVRVGGFANGQRVSSYEWFEPFLKANYHYIQTDIDHLPTTLEKVRNMPTDKMQAIACNGQRAFSALVNETSVRCYVRKTVQNTW